MSVVPVGNVCGGRGRGRVMISVSVHSVQVCNVLGLCVRVVCRCVVWFSRKGHLVLHLVERVCGGVNRGGANNGNCVGPLYPRVSEEV